MELLGSNHEKERTSDSHSDGSHAGSTPSVGDAEGLVQVQVGDVRPVVARPADPHLGVHVGSIQVDLGPRSVDQLANVPVQRRKKKRRILKRRMQDRSRYRKTRETPYDEVRSRREKMG